MKGAVYFFYGLVVVSAWWSFLSLKATTTKNNFEPGAFKVWRELLGVRIPVDIVLKFLLFAAIALTVGVFVIPEFILWLLDQMV